MKTQMGFRDLSDSNGFKKLKHNIPYWAALDSRFEHNEEEIEAEKYVNV